MKKILAFFSAIAFLGSGTLAVSACGVSKGQQIEIKTPNAPKKAKDGQDPLTEYVYNDKYYYSSNNTNYLIGLSAQLTSDKIYADSGKTFNSATWKEFYNSQEWQRGYFSSFGYDQTGALPSGEHDFSFRANNDQDLIVQLKENDASVDNNKIRTYWFVTSPTAWNASNPGDYKPTKNNITIPDVADFTDKNKIITKTGYIHLYLLIGKFRIDFSAEINFDFTKVVDKNNQPLVMIDIDTFAKPFGTIDFNHPEKTYDKVISNIDISTV